jgi:hypothetical protein
MPRRTPASNPTRHEERARPTAPRRPPEDGLSHRPSRRGFPRHRWAASLGNTPVIRSDRAIFGAYSDHMTYELRLWISDEDAASLGVGAEQAPERAAPIDRALQALADGLAIRELQGQLLLRRPDGRLEEIRLQVPAPGVASGRMENVSPAKPRKKAGATSRRTRSRAIPDVPTSEVREWARRQGVPLSSRGTPDEAEDRDRLVADEPQVRDE